MKNNQILTFVAICGLFTTLATNAFSETVKHGVATVVRIQGEAQYQLGDGQWHPLVVGKILGAGATIRTGMGAMVDIVLGGGGVSMPQAAPTPDRISLASDSTVRGMISYKPTVEQNAVRMTGATVLKIDKLTVSDTGADAVSDTELDLKKGRIFNSVKKLSGASQYLVKIPNGVAGVRGTLFGIGADGWLAVFKSSVLLSYIGPDGQPVTVLVKEGNLFDPQTGKPATLPPDLENFIGQIMISLRTLYTGDIDFTFDHGSWHVSPVHGHGHHRPHPQPEEG
jgi:hypothetical protein